MEVFLIILLIVLHNALVAGFYLMIRNERVGVFRITLNHLTSDLVINYINSFENGKGFTQHFPEYKCLDKASEHLRNKYTYEQMLFSFKPLRLESWFTEDELSFLKEYKQFIPNEQTLKCEVKKVLRDD